MFSQNNEEEHIIKYFEKWKKGRFLDLGAYDGKTFSNTHQLALNGWSGVCVEASAGPFRAMCDLYKGNDKIELVNALILPDTEDARFLMEFYCSADATSTIDEDHRATWAETTPFQKVWMQPIYMSSIERRFGNQFDFINIDLEGINFDVMMGIIAWDPQMICIEHDGDKYRTEQIKQIMGLEEIYRNQENVILAKPVDIEE